MRSKLCITLFLALGVLFLLQPAARADVTIVVSRAITYGGTSAVRDERGRRWSVNRNGTTLLVL